MMDLYNSKLTLWIDSLSHRRSMPLFILVPNTLFGMLELTNGSMWLHCLAFWVDGKVSKMLSHLLFSLHSQVELREGITNEDVHKQGCHTTCTEMTD